MTALDNASAAQARAEDYRLIIDGQRVEGVMSLDVVNPATGKVFATCARADSEQANSAVAAAKRAVPSWSSLEQSERNAYLHKLAAAIEARSEEIVQLLTREQGKPLRQARGEVGGAVACLRYYADFKLQPEILRDNDNEQIIEYRAPLGVLAAITPWNFPISLLVNKLAPALSAGNTMVAKPAPTTPLTTLLIGGIAAELLPPGVFNVIVDDNDLGPLLTAHPDIAKIGFTGSTATGKRVMESAAGTLKRLTLELGGNDAAIILDDVDVPVVARKVFDAAMVNAGQVCLAAKRIFVPRALYPAFCDAFARLAESAVVGDGSEEGVQIGPVQNRQQYEKLIGLIDQARTDGRIIAGGGAVDRPGYFIAPTVVCDIADDAALVRQEQFGPVMPVLPYDEIDEVVSRANDTEYGLGGTIWTSDIVRAQQLAKRLDTGTVWINKHLELPADVSFGGAKQSGIGREKGRAGIFEVTQAKVINISKVSLGA